MSRVRRASVACTLAAAALLLPLIPSVGAETPAEATSESQAGEAPTPDAAGRAGGEAAASADQTTSQGEQGPIQQGEQGPIQQSEQGPPVTQEAATGRERVSASVEPAGLDDEEAAEAGPTASTADGPAPEAQETSADGRPASEAQETSADGRPAPEAQETPADGPPPEAQETPADGPPPEAQETREAAEARAVEEAAEIEEAARSREAPEVEEAAEAGQAAPIERSTPVVEREAPPVQQARPGSDQAAPSGPSGAGAGSDARPDPDTVARSSGQRGTLLPLVQPLWSELSESQQQALQPFAEQWNSWSAADKRKWLALAGRIPRMKAEDRARAQRRITEWAALTPEQRHVARQNYRIARKLPPDERRAQWERYQQLAPEQQKALRDRGSGSNTAARNAGVRSGLAREAAQPLVPPPRSDR